MSDDAQRDERNAHARLIGAARRNLSRQLKRPPGSATRDGPRRHRDARSVHVVPVDGAAASRTIPAPESVTIATSIETEAAAAQGCGPERVERWFAAQGFAPFGFQRDAWSHYRAGRSGLVHAATGTGKTLAAWLGPVIEAIDAPQTPRAERRLRVLWITPMRALAADTLRALAAPLGALGLSWRIGLRTGDTPSADRVRQDRGSLDAIVTTPESLSLMLSRAGQAELFGGVTAVIVDEWHELIGSKRGVQVELALARLRRLSPSLRVWGLSATLGNLDEARDVLLAGGDGVTVAGVEPKTLIIDSLLPDDMRVAPWAGHLGTRAAAQVAAEIEQSRTTLVFTNTRSQAELWYQALLEQRPEWAGVLGLHHASLDIVGSSRVDLQACKLEYSIVSPK